MWSDVKGEINKGFQEPEVELYHKLNSFAIHVYHTPDKKELFPLCFYISVTFKHQAFFIFLVQLTTKMEYAAQGIWKASQNHL